MYICIYIYLEAEARPFIHACWKIGWWFQIFVWEMVVSLNIHFKLVVWGSRYVYICTVCIYMYIHIIHNMQLHVYHPKMKLKFETSCLSKGKLSSKAYYVSGVSQSFHQIRGIVFYSKCLSPNEWNILPRQWSTLKILGNSFWLGRLDDQRQNRQKLIWSSFTWMCCWWQKTWRSAMHKL